MQLEQLAPEVLVDRSSRGLVVVEEPQHRRVAHRGVEHVRELAEGMRADDVAVVRPATSQPRSDGRRDVEVVGEEVDHDLEQLAPRPHLPADGGEPVVGHRVPLVTPDGARIVGGSALASENTPHPGRRPGQGWRPTTYGDKDSQGRLIRNHQCIWVQMRTAGPGSVHFVQGGVRRNMDFAFMSDLEREFEISGEGYEAAGGGNHEFLMFPHVRELLVPESTPGMSMLGDEAVTYRKVWVWIVDGLRRTGKTIEIGGQTAEILDPSPGQFGVVALHEDPADALGYRITGPGISWQNSGYLTASVPQDGRITGKVHLKTGPPEEIAKWEEEGLAGCVGWLMAKFPFLTPLINFLRSLFGGS